MPDSCVKGVPLRTERCSNGRRRLLCSLVVEVQNGTDDGSSEEIAVPAEFVTDFSSIPTMLQWVVRWSKVDVAGVVHDWLYAKGEMPRERADKIWRIVALSGEHCANLVQAYVCWLGLRVWGWRAWNRHARARAANPAQGADPDR